MMTRFAWRVLREVDPRLLWTLATRCGWGGMRAVDRFNQRLKRGEYFPAFLFFSITNQCNLSCQGCWVTPSNPPAELSLETLEKVITTCKEKGNAFFGILGGEPLLHKGLFDLFERHPNCYFILFTNGLMLDAAVAQRLRRLGNVTPLISIEGLETESDARRGGSGVYGAALDALRYCHENKLFTGVATSVTRNSIDDLVSEKFVAEIAKRGAHYLWYYIYRPVGPHPSPERALSKEQILQLRRFMVEQRPKAPLMLVDAYWDDAGRALCPAVSGIAHHIAPNGAIELCPVLQFARENIGDGTGLAEKFQQSEFIQAFRSATAQRTRGCIIMEDPQWLAKFAREQGAIDSSGRGTVFEELDSFTPCASHDIPGEEIPEKSWYYRFAKKHWFFGFGAYG
ncbi:TPA: radical SAM protein [Candidatus Sumerlaeota bacterium]|nr:radical SAM protein [Candidatus Sumerlaeota bacterium]